MLTIGVLKEPLHETRVSMTPEVVAVLGKAKLQIWIEQDAGAKAFFDDEQYRQAGALIKSREDILREARLILSIHLPEAETLNHTAADTVWIGVYQPLFHPTRMQQWAERNHTVFSLDTLPRTTRAQAMDVLSSQANIAGYKAVVLAANTYPRYFPMLMTAAGSIPPAKVMILGAGVAGLQAIATARRLGCVVEVFDTRPAVKEEVMSLGAKFIEVEGAADASKAGGYAVVQTETFLQQQKEKIAAHAAKSDIIITTAQIPGSKAPILIEESMVAQMKPGSVIIDLAAATGGNTAYTIDNETVVHHQVTIIGNSALPASMPADSSKLYSKNVQQFLKLILDAEGNLNLNFEDDLVKGCCIVHDKAIVQERVAALLPA